MVVNTADGALRDAGHRHYQAFFTFRMALVDAALRPNWSIDMEVTGGNVICVCRQSAFLVEAICAETRLLDFVKILDEVKSQIRGCRRTHDRKSRIRGVRF